MGNLHMLEGGVGNVSERHLNMHKRRYRTYMGTHQSALHAIVYRVVVQLKNVNTMYTLYVLQIFFLHVILLFFIMHMHAMRIVILYVSSNTCAFHCSD